MVIFLFDLSMRWIAFRLDLLAGMINVVIALIFVFSKGLISPASAGLVFGLSGKVKKTTTHFNGFSNVKNC